MSPIPFRVSSTPLIYNRATRTFNSTYTVTNNGGQSIAGPFWQLVISALGSSVTVANATGTFQREPLRHGSCQHTLRIGEHLRRLRCSSPIQPTPPFNPRFLCIQEPSKMRTLVALTASCSCPTRALTTITYLVTADTSSVVLQSGYLDLQFEPNPSGSNPATVPWSLGSPPAACSPVPRFSRATPPANYRRR